MLANKLVLVTGSASGIGLAVAKCFANEGANVCMVDIQESLKDSINDLKVDFQNTKLTHSFYICDVSNKSKVEDLFEKIKSKYNRIPTVIVNCAGILVMKLFVDTNENDFDRVMDVNLKGTYLVSQSATKRLIENYGNVSIGRLETYASIINIASIVAKSALENISAYSASKAAIDNLTKCIAREVGKYKIRCNSILPGPIKTPMVTKVIKEEEMHVDNISLGRFGEPEEVAQVCLFLASEMGSYVTGASIECSGGMYQ